MIEITIPGNPIPNKRPRANMRTKHVYDPQKKEKEVVKKIIAKSIYNIFNGDDKNQIISASSLNKTVPIDIVLDFYLPYPVSLNNKNKNRYLWGFVSPSTKPDFDNLEKFILDCANKILYKDDGQIIHCVTKKFFSKNPRTIIKVMQSLEPNINADAEEILKLIPPQEFVDLLSDVNNIIQYITIDRNDDLKIRSESIEEKKEILTDVACFISRLADKHSSLLKKVSARYPGYWKKAQYFKQHKK